jgi:uncharacterized membrane protein
MTLEQRKIAEYLHERAKKLADVALCNGFPVAAQCFEMAALETELAIKSGTGAVIGSAKGGTSDSRRTSQGARPAKGRRYRTLSSFALGGLRS